MLLLICIKALEELAKVSEELCNFQEEIESGLTTEGRLVHL